MSARRGPRAGLALLVVLASCAGAGEVAAPAPVRFRDVRSIALVRAEDERQGSGKDPLDGLDETLRTRGFTTRVVELKRDRPPDQAALERLFRHLESRASSGRAERVAVPVRQEGREAADVVARLGVDAIATYHHLDRLRPPQLPPPMFAGTGFGAAPPPPALPSGALVLLDRSGNAAVFAWGDAVALEDPGVPVNAAEAIELVVRALTGEGEE